MKTISIYTKGAFREVEYTRKNVLGEYEVFTVPEFKIIAGIGYRRLKMLGIFNKYEKIIVVNERFHTKTRLEKLFILFHEIGHDKKGHLNSDAYGRVLRQELEADAYAADQLIRKYRVSPYEVLTILHSSLLDADGKLSKEGCIRVKRLEKHLSLQ